jgi:hypothetical protein
LLGFGATASFRPPILSPPKAGHLDNFILVEKIGCRLASWSFKTTGLPCVVK